MKPITLLRTLNRQSIDSQIIGERDYHDIVFKINGIKFIAGVQNDKIYDFHTNLYYDNASQETVRRFFDNFAQVLRYANRN